MTDPTEPNQRLTKARHATRNIILMTVCAMVLLLLLIVVASVMTAFSPLGILTHPPRWLVVLGHIAALCVAAFGGYASAYLARSRSRLGLAATGLFMAGVLYVLALTAFVWAVPVFTTALPTTPTTLEAQVTGNSNLSRARMGCRNRAYFGTGLVYAGHICMDGSGGEVPVGWTFRLTGDAAPWATRVTGFVRP